MRNILSITEKVSHPWEINNLELYVQSRIICITFVNQYVIDSNDTLNFAPPVVGFLCTSQLRLTSSFSDAVTHGLGLSCNKFTIIKNNKCYSGIRFTKSPTIC